MQTQVSCDGGWGRGYFKNKNVTFIIDYDFFIDLTDFVNKKIFNLSIKLKILSI